MLQKHWVPYDQNLYVKLGGDFRPIWVTRWQELRYNQKKLRFQNFHITEESSVPVVLGLFQLILRDSSNFYCLVFLFWPILLNRLFGLYDSNQDYFSLILHSSKSAFTYWISGNRCAMWFFWMSMCHWRKLWKFSMHCRWKRRNMLRYLSLIYSTFQIHTKMIDENWIIKTLGIFGKKSYRNFFSTKELR